MEVETMDQQVENSLTNVSSSPFPFINNKQKKINPSPEGFFNTQTPHRETKS